MGKAHRVRGEAHRVRGEAGADQVVKGGEGHLSRGDGGQGSLGSVSRAAQGGRGVGHMTVT